MTRIRARRTISVVLLVSVLLGGVWSVPAVAESSKEVRARAARIADQIDRIEREFEKLAEGYNEAAAQAGELDVELTASTARVQELDANLGGMREALRDFAVRMFASGGDLGGLGELLGGSTQLTDTVIRDQYASIALTSGQQASDQLEATLDELNTAKRKLQRQKDAKTKLVQTLESRRVATEAKQKQLERLQDQTNGDLKRALGEEQELREQRARQRAEATSNVRPRPVGNNGGGNNSGGGGNTGGGRGGNNGGGGNTGGGRGGNNGGGGNNGDGWKPPGREVPPPSPGASGAVAAAKSQIGVRYVPFMARPGIGFDCSGLTSWAWGRAGVRLPHQSRLQYMNTVHVDPADAEPGDLLFFYSPITHVAMYVGDGLMIDAATPRWPIRIRRFKWSAVVGVGRPR